MKNLFFTGMVIILIMVNTNTKAQHKMENNQALAQKEQSIVYISALTAVGNISQLKIQLNNGLDNGLTVNEIKEVLVQLYAYCGFPRSLNGINTFMNVLEERKAKGIQDTEGRETAKINDTNKYQTGKNTLQTLTRVEEKQLKGANAFAPAIDTFLKEHLFADIFSRDVLSYQQRELITISALAAMTGVAAQLQAHIGMGMNTGITKDQLSNVFKIIRQSIGAEQAEIADAALTKAIEPQK